MDPLYARYPFLSAAREAVEAAEVDLRTAIADRPAVVERARERVEWAITDGTVGEPATSPRVEVLSYPVARVIVSVVDQHVCTRRYARAEAAIARERFTEDLATDDELKTTADARLDLRDILAEFDLTGAVHERPAGFAVDVATYLDLAADRRGDEWRLTARELADGRVPVSEQACHTLLSEAVRARIADDLPLHVPDDVAEDLEPAVEAVEATLSDLDLTREIDTVVPELFPPCMQALLDDVQRGEHLEHHSRFAIAAFLTSIGLSTDEIVDLFQVNPGFGEEATRYQVDHIRGATSPTEYSTPACATMQSYGDCVNKDDICEDVIQESHPLNYYEHRLDEADEEDVTDWREREGDDEADA